jgi:hypothetical protein
MKVALNKRKRGILRKAMELSTVCSQKIYMVIYDEATLCYVEYRSHPNFDFSLINNKATREVYNNCDYDELAQKFIKREQHKKIQYLHSLNVPRDQPVDSIL